MAERVGQHRVREDVDVPLDGERIHLHRCASGGVASDRPLLLMVHGSTYSSGATFELPVEGQSMVDVLADAGIDVWTLDLVGYGRSTRPAAMDADPVANEPLTRTAEAAAQVGAACAYLLQRYGRRHLALLGWSWGTAICGSYAATHPDTIDRLVQIAPLWLRDGPSATDPGGTLGAYRVVNVAGIADRWLRGVPAPAREGLIPDGTVEALADRLLAADPGWSSAHPGTIRVPNGTVADTRAYWAAGRPVYDAGAIRCPVLVMAGEWDQEWQVAIAERYLAELTHAAARELIVVPQATHSLLLERHRDLVYRAVIDFLTDTGRDTVA